MTSISTNDGAISALQVLRSLSNSMQDTQRQISSGLRVGMASDNAAYWSIATTMRSDNMALSAVQDALGLGAAKVDTAYAGMTAVVDVLKEFNAKLVTASEESVDKAKIQEELEQLKQQVQAIAHSSSFSSQNWLVTDIEDIYDRTLDIARVTSSFVRDSSGGVSVKSAEFHLSEVSLFNKAGGGLLQKDSRISLTIGGIRNYDTFTDDDGVVRIDRSNTGSGLRAKFEFTFTGPMTFDDPSDKISFDVIVDADNPDDLDPPYNLGKSSPVEITRAKVLAVLPGSNGVISTYEDYIKVLNHAMADTGASAGFIRILDANGHSIRKPNAIEIYTEESSGLNGSFVEIRNFNSGTIGNGGLSDQARFGTRGSGMFLQFTPFTVHLDSKAEDDVEIRFNFSVNRAAPTSHVFNRSYVNQLFDRETGKVETAEEMVTLLKSLVSSDWPDVMIEVTSPSSISVHSDRSVDRLSGVKTNIGFTGIDVSIEPLSDLNFLEIDVEAKPNLVPMYIGYMNTTLSKITSGAAALGALSSRIDMQSKFVSKLTDSIDSGIGRLVDADMNEASTRLKALQTQEQLAIQSLSIANANAEGILTLFR